MTDTKDNIFGNKMTVGEAISLLAYSTRYEIKGSYSGKIYHRSWRNKEKNIEKFLDRTTVDNPFYAALSLDKGSNYCSSVIGIWMHDYDLCRK